MLLVVAVTVGIGGWLWARQQNSNLPFPALPTALNAGQTRVLETARTEFEAPGASTKYSQGVAEQWCADFVSWTYRQAGLPFKNPNSGGWRIPGVFTMTDYFVKEKRWHARGSGYLPQPGDVVVYKTGSFMGAHVNIVIRRDGDTLTTVGGNQPGISVLKIDRTDDAISGFGNPRTA